MGLGHDPWNLSSDFVYEMRALTSLGMHLARKWLTNNTKA